MRKLVNAWLGKAGHDLGVAKLTLEHRSDYTDVVCFHRKQAAEWCRLRTLTLRRLQPSDVPPAPVFRSSRHVAPRARRGKAPTSAAPNGPMVSLAALVPRVALGHQTQAGGKGEWQLAGVQPAGTPKVMLMTCSSAETRPQLGRPCREKPTMAPKRLLPLCQH